MSRIDYTNHLWPESFDVLMSDTIRLENPKHPNRGNFYRRGERVGHWSTYYKCWHCNRVFLECPRPLICPDRTCKTIWPVKYEKRRT